MNRVKYSVSPSRHGEMLKYDRPGAVCDPKNDASLTHKTPCRHSWPLLGVVIPGSGSGADEGHCKLLVPATGLSSTSQSQREPRPFNSDCREQQGPIVTCKDDPATSSSLRRSKSGPPSTSTSSDVSAPFTDLQRISSETDLRQHRHFDVISRSWTKGIPTAGSTSPRVQQLHREMLDVFEQAVEEEVVVQVAAVSPRRRYIISPARRRESAQERSWCRDFFFKL